MEPRSTRSTPRMYRNSQMVFPVITIFHALPKSLAISETFFLQDEKVSFMTEYLQRHPSDFPFRVPALLTAIPQSTTFFSTLPLCRIMYIPGAITVKASFSLTPTYTHLPDIFHIS